MYRDRTVNVLDRSMLPVMHERSETVLKAFLSVLRPSLNQKRSKNDMKR